MKNYASNKILKKIALILTIIMVFNFAMPNFSKATEESGGDMFTPLSDFLAKIGDLVIIGVQKIFTGDGQIVEETTQIDEEIADELILFKQAIRATKCITDIYNLELSVEDGTYSWNTGNADTLLYKVRDRYDYGTFEYGYIQYFYTLEMSKEIDAYSEEWVQFITGKGMIVKTTDISNLATAIANVGGGDKETVEAKLTKTNKLNIQITDEDINDYFVNHVNYNTTGETGTTTKVYSIKYGPANIFAGTIPAFDINFFNPMQTDSEENEKSITNVGEEGEKNTKRTSAAQVLRQVVSGWYQALQKLTLVALLSVLVYVAIRTIISSIGEDKAKYKKMIKDWLVAICIVFTLHYIMAFALAITLEIRNIFETETVGEQSEDKLMSKLRNDMEDEQKYTEVFTNIVMYLTLVIFTVTFSIQYLKRTIYMAFLTIIAPLIAFTYPLDKIKDGQAQAFNMWIKEYIFNALIQPVHLILYFIFLGSAEELVNAYPLYGIVVLGFLIPAEKLIRKMFGFEKASTVSALGSIAGGEAVMKMVNKVKPQKKKK